MVNSPTRVLKTPRPSDTYKPTPPNYHSDVRPSPPHNPGKRNVKITAIPEGQALQASERLRLCGISCPDEIRFLPTTWDVGEEVTVTFPIRNDWLVPVTIKYTLPRSRFLSLPYPKPIKIPPGLTEKIPVTFKPTAYEPLLDEIVVHVKTPAVADVPPAVLIRIRAEVNTLSISHKIPNATVDFGIVPAGETRTKIIHLYNTGSRPARITWKLLKPFSLDPDASPEMIPVGGSAEYILRIFPETGQTIDGLVVATATAGPSIDDLSRLGVGDENNHHMLHESQEIPLRVYGIAKVPHLLFTKEDSTDQRVLTTEDGHVRIDFGSCSPGITHSVEVNVTNATPVSTSFFAKPIVKASPFDIRLINGLSVDASNPCSIGPLQSISLLVSYKSSTVLEEISADFEISTVGLLKNVLVVSATARCDAIPIKMSAKSLTFEEVEVGTRCTKVFHIINYSPDVTTQYQVVQTRCNDVGEGVAYSVLELDNHCGVIEPRSTATVVVTARPEIPYNHYRRLWVLVRHAAEPLYVDCIVNSFNADHHPMKLTYAHVKLWRAITSADLSSFPPPNSNDNKLPPSVALDDSEGPSNGWEELVKATGLVSERAVTFGACSPANGPYLRKISVNNPSPGRVMVYWPSRNATCKPAFEIRPGSGEIPGSNTREFTIEYHPPTEGDCRYTVASMDCVMVPKENRSYRFGDAAMLVPPHTSTIVATAHSWPSERHAEPKVTVNSATKESTSVRFRGVTPGQTDAQVIVLHNSSDIVIGYCAEWFPHLGHESTLDAFQCFPPIGAIEPRGFALVAVLYHPRVTTASTEEAVDHSGYFKFLLNDIRESAATVHVQGKCWISSPLKIGSDNQVVTFPPTVTGTVTSVSTEITNLSGVSLKWKLDIPEQGRSLFSLPITYGELPAFGTTNALMTYHPSVIPPTHEVDTTWITATTVPLSGGKEWTTRVKLIGFSQEPQLRCEPPVIDLGPIPTLCRVSAPVRVSNLSSVEIYYLTRVDLLSYQPLKGDPHPPPDADLSTACTVRDDDLRGMLAPGAAEAVVFSVNMTFRGKYQFRLEILPLSAPSEMTPTSSNLGGGPLASVIIIADCQSPVVQIRDLRVVSDNLHDVNEHEDNCVHVDLDATSGPARPLSALWQYMMIDEINSALRSPITDTEKDLMIKDAGWGIGPDKTEELFDRLEDTSTLNLATASVGSSTVTIYAAVTNTSDVSAKLKIITPEDVHLKGSSIPLWAYGHLEGQDMEEARHHQWVMEEHLIDVRPRRSVIEPGKSVHLKFTYRFAYVGTHVIPVVLQLEHGKLLRLFLTGTTLPRGVPKLSVRQDNINLVPVPIGRGTCLQTVELSNIGGDVGDTVAAGKGSSGSPATWRIRSNCIEEFNKTNYNFKVLEIRPSSGVLKPNASTYLDILFCPLEAIEYHAQVFIELVEDTPEAVLVKEELAFTLVMSAFDPRQRSSLTSSSSVFSPSLPLQACSCVLTHGAALSVEHLDFGHVKAGATVHRITVLVNYTEDMVMHYRWDLRGLLQPDGGSSRMVVQPEEGVIAPKSSQIVVFTLGRVDAENDDNEVAMIAIDGEVECSIVSWTPVDEMNDNNLMSYSDDPTADQSEEIIVEHKDHRHEPAFSMRDPFRPKHVSVVNRLTVSRYRHLASTIGGQKYLNENLGRSVMLSVDLPSEARVDDLHQSLVQSMLQNSDSRDRESIARNATREDGKDSIDKVEGFCIDGKPSRCPLHVRITVRPSVERLYEKSKVSTTPFIASNEAEQIIQHLLRDVFADESLSELIKGGISTQSISPLLHEPSSPRPAAPRTADDVLWNVPHWEITPEGTLIASLEDNAGQIEEVDSEVESLIRDARGVTTSNHASMLLVGTTGWENASEKLSRNISERESKEKKMIRGECGALRDLSRIANETLKDAVLTAIEEMLGEATSL